MLEAPIEFLEVTILYERSKKITEELEVRKTLQGYKVPKKRKLRSVKRTAESRNPPPTRKIPSEPSPKSTPQPSLVARAGVPKQKSFRLKVIDSRANKLEDQRIGMKAHTPSPHYVEPQDAVTQHVISTATRNVPQWVL